MAGRGGKIVHILSTWKKDVRKEIRLIVNQVEHSDHNTIANEVFDFYSELYSSSFSFHQFFFSDDEK